METHTSLFSVFDSHSQREKRLLAVAGETPAVNPSPDAKSETSPGGGTVEQKGQRVEKANQKIADLKAKLQAHEEQMHRVDAGPGPEKANQEEHARLQQELAQAEREGAHYAADLSAASGMGFGTSPGAPVDTGKSGGSPVEKPVPKPGDPDFRGPVKPETPEASTPEAPRTEPADGTAAEKPAPQPGDPDSMGPVQPEEPEAEPKTLGESLDKMIRDNKKILNDPTADAVDRGIAALTMMAALVEKMRNITRLNEPLSGAPSTTAEGTGAASPEDAKSKSEKVGEGSETSPDDAKRVQNPEKEAKDLEPKIEADQKEEKELETKRVDVAKRLQDALTKQTADGDSTSAEREEIAKLTQELKELDQKIDAVEKRLKEKTDRKDALDKEQARRRDLVEKNIKEPLVSRGIGIENVTLEGDSIIFKLKNEALVSFSEKFKKQPDFGINIETNAQIGTFTIKNMPPFAWDDAQLKELADALAPTQEEREADPALGGAEAVGHEIMNIENLLKVSAEEAAQTDMDKQNKQMEGLLKQADEALDKADTSKGVVRGQIVERLGLSDKGKEVPNSGYRIAYDNAEKRIVVRPA